MSEVIRYVGIDVHTRELHVAMLIGPAATPKTWTVANEPKAIQRLQRKLEREAPGVGTCVTRRARAAMRCSGRSRRAG